MLFFSYFFSDYWSLDFLYGLAIEKIISRYLRPTVTHFPVNHNDGRFSDLSLNQHLFGLNKVIAFTVLSNQTRKVTDISFSFNLFLFRFQSDRRPTINKFIQLFNPHGQSSILLLEFFSVKLDLFDFIQKRLFVVGQALYFTLIFLNLRLVGK